MNFRANAKSKLTKPSIAVMITVVLFALTVNSALTQTVERFKIFFKL